MTTSISINDNRVAVRLDSTVAQFVVWDLKSSQHEDFTNQLNFVFSVCKNFDDIQRHLRLNGFDATLEDIYND